MSNLIPFNPANDDHVEAFNYFANEHGHPEYVLDGKVSDVDFDFREFLAKKFSKDQSFIDDANGCEHVLIAHNGDIATLRAYYYADAPGGGDDIVGVQFDGKLFFDTSTERVVIEPDVTTIVEA